MSLIRLHLPYGHTSEFDRQARRRKITGGGDLYRGKKINSRIYEIVPGATAGRHFNKWAPTEVTTFITAKINPIASPISSRCRHHAAPEGICRLVSLLNCLSSYPPLLDTLLFIFFCIFIIL